MPRIKSFPADQVLRLVEWIGPLLPMEGKRPQPQIHIHLTSDSLDLWGEASGEPPAPSDPEARHRRALVFVSGLPLIRPGSIWRGWERRFAVGNVRAVKCEVAVRDTEVVAATAPISTSRGTVTPLDLLSRRLSPAAAAHAKHSYFVALRPPATEYELLLVPAVVIFQACMATSPRLIRRLLLGQLDKIVDLRRCHFVPWERKTFFVELFRDFDTREAPAIANLVADPAGARSYERMRRSFIHQRVEHQRGVGSGGLHLQLSWPFTQPAEVVALGRPIALDPTRENGPQALIVDQFESIKPRYPFTKLIVARKNDAHKKVEEDTAGLKDFKTTPKQTPELQLPLLVSHSGHPEPHFKKKEVTIFGALDNKDLKIVSHFGLVQRYRSLVVAGDGLPKVPSGEVVPADAARPNPGHTELDTKELLPPSAPAVLKHFLHVLAHLRREGLDIQTIAVATDLSVDPDTGEVINVFPAEIEGLRDWQWVEEGPDHIRRRFYIVACTRRGQRWHYFIDIERKEHERYGLGYLRSIHPQGIGRDDLQQFMDEFAQAKSWRNCYHFEFGELRSVPHLIANGTEAFAHAILRRLKLTPAADGDPCP